MPVEFMRAAITSGEEGTFRAVASASDSVANGERGPTRFSSSAFAESLERSARYPLLWQHKDDQPVGVAHLSMGDEGLVLDGQLALEVQRAREARELLKMGALDGVSIGFTAQKSRMETHGGKSIRVVEQARLMEVSIVTFPADPNARVLTVHREGEHENIAEWLAEADVALLDGKADVEAHAGRQFSEGNLTKLRAALGTLVDLVEKVDPGHIAAIGRRAAQSMKKSFLLMPKKGGARAKCAAAIRNERLRLMDMHALGVEGVPLLKTEFEPYPEQEIEPERALMNALQSAMGFPEEARKILCVEIVKQYLVASGDAEGVDEEDAAPAGREGATEDGSAEVTDGDGKK